MTREVSAPDINDVQAQKIIDRCDPRDKVIMLLSFTMGLRASEIAGLRISDVIEPDRKIKTTLVLRSEIAKGGKRPMKPSGKGTAEQKIRRTKVKGDKQLPFGGTVPELDIALQAYLYSIGAEYSDKPLFANRTGTNAGKQISPNFMVKIMKACYDRAGVKGRSHSGRKYFATTLARDNKRLEVIQELMRHQSIEMTRAYINVTMDEKIETRKATFSGKFRV